MWRRVWSGEWRITAVLLGLVALFAAGPIVDALGLRFPFAWLAVALGIVVVGSWWLAPDGRSARSRPGSAPASDTRRDRDPTGRPG